MTYHVRLLELAALAGDPFISLVGQENLDAWVNLVVKERNELAHHFGRPADYDMTPVLYVSRVAYWLAVLCFLRAAEAPNAVFERWMQHHDIDRLRQNVATLFTTP